MDAISILQTKRQNLRPHTNEELKWWIDEYSKGNIPDYQMASWLMAVCWRGMTKEETATLCRCMVESGALLTWNNLPYLVDKHSTGGVGDKISIVLAPLVAALGVKVPMMAGRGLGHTGGTIDKLESITGYRTGLSIPEFQKIVTEVGCSIVSASSELCLADRKLYALRDVTATVSCIPLQTASIMCKKIAEHPNSLVLDVKYGKASFQSDREGAETLAKSMIATGEANGLVPTTCLLTRMDSVIGTSVGNWLEIEECLDLLKYARGSPDLVALVVVEAAQMLLQSGKYNDLTMEDCIQLCLEALESGKAWTKFQDMVKAHGGNLQVQPSPPRFTMTLKAVQSGFLLEFDGLLVGNLCVQLGAGRQIADEQVDPMAGIRFLKRPGDSVKVGDELAIVQTNRDSTVLQRVCTQLEKVIGYSEEPVSIDFPISHLVTSKDGVTEFTVPDCLTKR